MSTDFTELLDTKADDCEPPKPLPAGRYHASLKQHKMRAFQGKDGTEYVTVEFFFRLLDAVEGVDDDELEAITNWREKTPKATFFLGEDRSYRVVDLARNLGVETEGLSLGEVIDEMMNIECEIVVSIRTAPDGREFSEIENGAVYPVGD